MESKKKALARFFEDFQAKVEQFKGTKDQRNEMFDDFSHKATALDKEVQGIVQSEIAKIQSNPKPSGDCFLIMHCNAINALMGCD